MNIKLSQVEADGKLTSSLEETYQALIHKNFPPDANRDAGRIVLETREPDIVNDIVTEKGVRMTITGLGPYKAPGRDGIFPKMIQTVKDEITPALVEIGRACLRHCHVPMKWRDSIVVFLPKPGKESYQKCGSWRPISLTSFLLKILEKELDGYIRTPELINKLRANHQFAYIKGISTEAAIHQIVGRAEATLRTEEYGIAIFLDVRGAFNETTFRVIEQGMLRHHVNPLCYNFISKMLRTRAVMPRGSQICVKVERGCPQGGVLSPLLWNLVVDEVLGLLRTTVPQVYSQGFADDLAGFARGKFPDEVSRDAQMYIDIVSRWADRVDLGVDDKAETILFTSKRQPVENLNLRGRTLPFSKQARYLGVIIDRRLTWMHHIENRVDKGIKTMAMCKRALGPTWGLKPRIILWIYKMIILPMMTYACVVWCPAGQQESKARKLVRVQRSALVAASGCIKSTPTSSLECILGITPIQLTIGGLALRTMLRLRHTGVWLNWEGRGSQGPTSHIDHCKRLADRIPGLTDVMTRKVEYQKSAVTKIINDWVAQCHSAEWAASAACRHTKIFIKAPGIDSILGKSTQKLSRGSLRLLTQVLTNHCVLNDHMHKMGRSPSPDCLCGRGRETGYHLLCECDRHSMTRLVELEELHLAANDIQLIPADRIVSFIKKTGRFGGEISVD